MKAINLSMIKRISIAIILFLVIFTASACSQASNKSITDSRSRSDFTDKTEQKTIRVDIRPGLRNNKLHLNVHLDSGSCSWKLIDPNGSILWQDSISGNTNFNKMRDLPRTLGEWRLEISLENASGKYDIKWNGAK